MRTQSSSPSWPVCSLAWSTPATALMIRSKISSSPDSKENRQVGTWWSRAACVAMFKAKVLRPTVGRGAHDGEGARTQTPVEECVQVGEAGRERLLVAPQLAAAFQAFDQRSSVVAEGGGRAEVDKPAVGVCRPHPPIPA